jgi:hypothetical protein
MSTLKINYIYNNKMIYIKILLTLYLLLRIANIIPSRKLVMNNDLYNTMILILLCLISLTDIHVALILSVCILLNTKNLHIETLFQQYSPSEISELVNTLHLEPVESKPEPEPEPESEPVNPIIKKKDVQIGKVDEQLPLHEPKNDCNSVFIISEEMLLNAQDNKVSDNSFVNIVPNQHINIQGFQKSMSGFNI